MSDVISVVRLNHLRPPTGLNSDPARGFTASATTLDQWFIDLGSMCLASEMECCIRERECEIQTYIDETYKR
jgi:hypothetical protein